MVGFTEFLGGLSQMQSSFLEAARRILALSVVTLAGTQFLAAQTSSPSTPSSATNNNGSVKATNPVTTGPLPGHGLAQHPFLYCGEWNFIEPNQTIYLVRHGKVEWTYSILIDVMVYGKPQKAELGDCTRFSNGDILFSYRWGASVVTPQKKIIWDYRAAPNTEIHSAQPAGKNRVLLAQNGDPTKLFLINTASGKVEKELALPTPYPDKVHGQLRRAHLTKAGTFLVGLMEENRVAEFNADGKEVWSFTTPDARNPVYPISAWDAVRLKNGNTLISGDEHGYVVEVDPKGEIVWELGKNELPGFPLDVVQEVGRLANGNTVIANWVAGNTKPENWPATIQIIEVTPAKKVVWALRQWKDPDLGPASSIQLLDQPGVPENGDLQR
jgi:outer membrane protein assembly factor BamB